MNGIHDLRKGREQNVQKLENQLSVLCSIEIFQDSDLPHLLLPELKRLITVFKGKSFPAMRIIDMPSC